MYRTYKKIDHKIFKLQELVEVLVVEIFCKADRQRCLTKIKAYPTLQKLYENNRSDWFKTSVEAIYSRCKLLTDPERQSLTDVFRKNNEIEYLCSHPTKRQPLDLLNEKVAELLIPFFKEFYDRFLKWKDVFIDYGTKKEYYDDLLFANKDNIRFCPGCGYGIVKSFYNKGHSAFDHYLPLKHYPFSVVNFMNLFPLCTECNTDNKGDKDILAADKKVFYPFAAIHPTIACVVDVDPKSMVKFVIGIEKIEDRIKTDELHISFDYDKKYQEEIESWDLMFGITIRYFEQVATSAVPWLNDVREKNRDSGKPFRQCFDDIIRDDSNKPFGFLKAPFLGTLKKFDSLIEAIVESTGSHKINAAKPIS